jgi:hypothetical protein
MRLLHYPKKWEVVGICQDRLQTFKMLWISAICLIWAIEGLNIHGAIFRMDWILSKSG